MWTRIAALIIKELLAVWQDKKSRVVIIVPPLLQLIVFGYAASYDLDRVAIAVVNEDTGVLSRDFVARFEGSPTFEIVARPAREADIRRLVDTRKVKLVVRVDQTFSRDLLAGRPARVPERSVAQHGSSLARGIFSEVRWRHFGSTVCLSG